jgi:hypothetical protein
MKKSWAAIIIGVAAGLLVYSNISALSPQMRSSLEFPTTIAATTTPSLLSTEAEISSEFLIGISFPPVTDIEDREFTLEQLHALGIEHIRIAEDWSYREPVEGQFKWDPLDERIEWAVQNQISLLLTIQANGPDWACDLNRRNERSCVFRESGDFENYITALLLRYPNQIEKIQFGNEWASDNWYLGTPEEFVTFHNILYQAVQQFSPQTQVVLGGLSTDQLRVLAFCQGKVDAYFRIDGELISEVDDRLCSSQDFTSFLQRFEYVIHNTEYDLIDFHFYDDAESWPNYYQAAMEHFPELYPVIVSEFGGPNLDWEQPYSDQFQAERLADYFNVFSRMEVSEVYYFKLVQSDSTHPSHRESGLFREVGGQPIAKPAFFVFQEYSLSK